MSFAQVGSNLRLDQPDSLPLMASEVEAEEQSAAHTLSPQPSPHPSAASLPSDQNSAFIQQAWPAYGENMQEPEESIGQLPDVQVETEDGIVTCAQVMATPAGIEFSSCEGAVVRDLHTSIMSDNMQQWCHGNISQFQDRTVQQYGTPPRATEDIRAMSDRLWGLFE